MVVTVRVGILFGGLCQKTKIVDSKSDIFNVHFIDFSPLKDDKRQNSNMSSISQSVSNIFPEHEDSNRGFVFSIATWGVTRRPKYW